MEGGRTVEFVLLKNRAVALETVCDAIHHGPQNGPAAGFVDAENDWAMVVEDGLGDGRVIRVGLTGGGFRPVDGGEVGEEGFDGFFLGGRFAGAGVGHRVVWWCRVSGTWSGGTWC